jgi:hypothetical protein
MEDGISVYRYSGNPVSSTFPLAHGERSKPIGICRHSLAVFLCGPISITISPYAKERYTEGADVERSERYAGPKCVRYVPQSLGSYFQIFLNPAAPRVLDPLLLALIANVRFFPLLDARSSSTALSAESDKAALLPRYIILVLFQQWLVDVDLDSCYDRHL